MTSLTKKLETENQKYFSLQTRRLAGSFEGLKLNSSLAQSAEELWSYIVIAF